MTTLLITCLPHSAAAKKALNYASDLLSQDKSVSVFFYADGAYIANDLVWQSQDIPNIADEWLALSERYQLKLPVCVASALARGISDEDNAKRHHLRGANLKMGFTLVGLSEFALMIDTGDLVQF